MRDRRKPSTSAIEVLGDTSPGEDTHFVEPVFTHCGPRKSRLCSQPDVDWFVRPPQVLEDDADLAMMNLTRMAHNPEEYVGPLSDCVLQDHEEMELLLEAYLQVPHG